MQVKAQGFTVDPVFASASPIDRGVGTSVLSVKVTGGTGIYTYQWMKKIPGATSFTDISSATGSNYTFAPLSSDPIGVYQFEVEVTDLFFGSIISEPATVTVNALPTVSVAPVGPVTLDVGQVRVFTATASGGSGSLSYQWYRGGSAVSGATDVSYSFSGSVGLYSVSCRVTDSASTPVTSASNAVSVTVNPALVAPSVSASVGVVTQGQTSSLTSSSVTTGTSPYSYQWLQRAPGAGSYSSISGATLASYSFVTSGSTATGAWSFELRVTDSASAVVTSTGVSVTVNPALVAPSVSASVGVVTQGQTSSLTSSSVTTGTSPYSYQWLQRAPGAGSYSSISGATLASYSFVTSGSTATGAWSFELRVTDSASAVVTSTGVSVMVNAVPTVVVSPTSWIMDVGQSKVFSATASGGSGSYTSYQWYVGGAAQSGATASTFSYAPGFAGSYSITVSVTDSLGVTSVQSSAASVTVAASPTVSVAPVGPVTLDVGQVRVFTATASGGSGSLSYQWYRGGSAVSGATDVSYSFSGSVGLYSVSCRVTDSASTPVTSASNAVSVTVNPALVAPSVSASVGVVTQGQTSSLTSSSVTTGTSPYSYQWLQRAPGAGSYSSISGATLASYSFVTSGSTATGAWSFELRVTDSASAVVTSTGVSVMVNAVPTVVVSPTSWIMDVGQSKVFSATASGGSGSYTSYQWYVGGAAQSGATASTFSYAPGFAGSYSITVSVTDSLGVTSVQSSAASVTVAASPTVSVAPVGPVTLDVGQVRVFTATASGGSGSLSYQWYRGGSAVSGATDVSYSFSGSVGLYSVSCRVTDSASTPVTSASNAVSVTVNPALVAPSVSASVGVVTQGQTSSLTSSSVTTGTSPYSYQWLQRAPGAGSYSSISGATLASYSFVTSIATAAGSWNFILQVKDSAGAAVNSTTVSVTVNIPPLDHFVFSSVGTQTAGTSFSVTITAKDASNNTLTNYVGTNSLNVSTGTINPISTGVFSSGVWSGSVIVNSAGSGVTLFTTSSGMSGTSNSFTINPGALNKFTFSTINSPQTAGSVFTITVSAKDAYGNNVTSYTGTPSLIYSDGSISPSVMNVFVNGVGSTSVTVDTAGSDATITVTDGSRSGISNSFTVTKAPTSSPSPTPTPLLTPDPTSTSLSTPTSTSAPNSTPTSTSTPSSSVTPFVTNVTVTTDTGTTVTLINRGNLTGLQISNVTIQTNQSAVLTTVSFTLTGEGGPTGFCIMTIPKTVVPNGTTPIVFIDGPRASNQGYTQDDTNFYVWYTTQFSTHQVKIQFDASSTSQATLFGPLFAVAITVPEIILIYTVIAIRRLKRKPENT